MRYLYAIFLSMLFCSCVKNEFKVVVDLPESVTSTYRLVYYASDSRGGLSLESAMAVTKGKGEFTGTTKNPALVLIFDGSSSTPSAAFYARRGDKIRVTGPDSDPTMWRINGNAVTDQITEWRLANQEAIERREQEKINKSVAEYVKKNPDSPAATLIFSVWYDSNLTPDESQKLMGMLKGDAIESQLLECVARLDLLEVLTEQQPVKVLKDIVVQGLPTGRDTLRCDRGVATAILIRSDKYADDRKALETLREMAKSHPDSSKRNLAELYLAADSSAWVNAIRRDTLKGVLRARIPHEFADPTIISVGATKAPWWVITDKKGKIIYSGTDSEKAKSFYNS